MKFYLLSRFDNVQKSQSLLIYDIIRDNAPMKTNMKELFSHH